VRRLWGAILLARAALGLASLGQIACWAAPDAAVTVFCLLLDSCQLVDNKPVHHLVTALSLLDDVLEGCGGLRIDGRRHWGRAHCLVVRQELRSLLSHRR
jgi:hypothetical protein